MYLKLYKVITLVIFKIFKYAHVDGAILAIGTSGDFFSGSLHDATLEIRIRTSI